MSKYINKLIQRGAAWRAQERGLAQKKSEKARFVETDQSKYPKAGDHVATVSGKKIYASGRILPCEPELIQAERHLRAVTETVAVEFTESVSKAIRETPKTKKPLPEEIRTRKEPNPSLHAYRKPGRRRESHVKRHHNRWSQSVPNILIYS